MRVIGVAMVASLVAACASGDRALAPDAPPPSAGLWKIEQRPDRITGAAAPTAYVASTATNARNLFPRATLLQLMCFKNQPIVRLAFDFRVGSNRSATVAYRFDQRPGREVGGRFLADYKTFVIEDTGAVAQFVEELRVSEALFVRVNSLVVGRTNAEFRVAGAAAAIDAAFSGCPLTNGGPRPSA